MKGPMTYCCKVMALALERQHPSLGLVTGTSMNFKTGKTSDAIVIKFRRAKRTDDTHGGPLADTTFGWVMFCPFCGRPTRREREATKATT